MAVAQALEQWLSVSAGWVWISGRTLAFFGSDCCSILAWALGFFLLTKSYWVILPFFFLFPILIKHCETINCTNATIKENKSKKRPGKGREKAHIKKTLIPLDPEIDGLCLGFGYLCGLVAGGLGQICWPPLVAGGIVSVSGRAYPSNQLTQIYSYPGRLWTQDLQIMRLMWWPQGWIRIKRSIFLRCSPIFSIFIPLLRCRFIIMIIIIPFKSNLMCEAILALKFNLALGQIDLLLLFNRNAFWGPSIPLSLLWLDCCFVNSFYDTFFS